MPNPFGLVSGETPKSTNASYYVSFHSVPNPHPDLKNYRGTWDPALGLNSVLAASAPFQDDAYGRAAKQLYSRLKQQLSTVYGKSEQVEYIDDDAVWDNDDEFVRSIFEEERGHMTVWSKEHGSKLDAAIKKIILSIDAEADDVCCVSLMYGFTDEPIGRPGEEVGLGSL